MNVYDSFFLGMTPEEWEFFAIDFLSSIGFTIERFPSRGQDTGRDGLVSLNHNIYLVSCKHYLASNKAVGLPDEPSIIDRIVQNSANGFIGFYSTLLSTSLDERFIQLSNSGYECICYDGNKISNFLPKISSHVLQKYGIPNQLKYVLNIPKYDYHPLPCLGCGVDILADEIITSSMALICLNQKNELEYLYGCKRCLVNIVDCGWVSLYQALHQEELNGWIGWVREAMNIHTPSQTFYKHKSEFESAIQQRMFPSNWGRWLSF